MDLFISVRDQLVLSLTSNNPDTYLRFLTYHRDCYCLNGVFRCFGKRQHP